MHTAACSTLSSALLLLTISASFWCIRFSSALICIICSLETHTSDSSSLLRDFRRIEDVLLQFSCLLQNISNTLSDDVKCTDQKQDFLRPYALFVFSIKPFFKMVLYNVRNLLPSVVGLRYHHPSTVLPK